MKVSFKSQLAAGALQLQTIPETEKVDSKLNQSMRYYGVGRHTW